MELGSAKKKQKSDVETNSSNEGEATHQLVHQDLLGQLPLCTLDEGQRLTRVDEGDLGALPSEPVTLNNEMDLLTVPTRQVFKLNSHLRVFDFRVGNRRKARSVSDPIKGEGLKQETNLGTGTWPRARGFRFDPCPSF
jgi:hypothetical protein